MPASHSFDLWGSGYLCVILDINETSKSYNELKGFNVQQMNGGDLLKWVENQRKTKKGYIFKKWRQTSKMMVLILMRNSSAMWVCLNEALLPLLKIIAVYLPLTWWQGHDLSKDGSNTAFCYVGMIGLYDVPYFEKHICELVKKKMTGHSWTWASAHTWLFQESHLTIRLPALNFSLPCQHFRSKSGKWRREELNLILVHYPTASSHWLGLKNSVHMTVSILVLYLGWLERNHRCLEINYLKDRK